MRERLPIIVSTTALLIAVLGVTPLGEAAYDAVVPRNSVGTLQLKRNAVKARQLAPNSVRSAHVLNGSLLVADFKPGQIPQGPKGEKGDKGETGAAGAQGPPGLSGYQVVVGTAVNIGPGGGQIANASCPAGKRAVGGGGISNSTGTYLYASGPTNTGWLVAARNTGGVTTTLSPYAVCATVAP